MNENERNAAFPVHIDLGKKEDSTAMPMPVGPSGKKGKPRMQYPTLYIDAVEGLDSLPKEGCILVKYRRKRLSLEEGYDGKETTGATLEIQSLCLPESMDGGDTLEDAFKRVGKAEKEEYADDEDDDDEE